MTTCQGKTKSGDGCRAPAQPGRSFCIHHDPALAGRRRSWHREGGRARIHPLRPLPTPIDCEVSLSTPAEVRRVVEAVARALLEGKLTERRANALGYLLQISLKCGEAEALERLTALEERFGVSQ